MKFVMPKHPMDLSEICRTVDRLIDRWCGRREIGPLQELLRVYPGVLAHTDQKSELLHAIKAVQGGHRGKLTDDELDMLIAVHNALDDAREG